MNIRLLKENREGMVMVSFILMIAVLAVAMTAMASMALTDVRASERAVKGLQAFYIAEAGVDIKISELNVDNTAAIPPTSFSDGSYSVSMNVGVSAEVVATGMVEDVTRTIRMHLKRGSAFTGRAAIFVNGASAATTGGIDIDGRDHTAAGVLTGDPGVPGISLVGSTLSQGGSSGIGGNGIAPARPADPGAYELNAGPYPNTPEELFGLEPGDLDIFKTGTPSFPMNGVHYVTSSMTPVNFGNYSEGILICHNASYNCKLKNLHQDFRGIIIADEIEHINGSADIHGMVIVLNPTGVTLGNGNANVRFSSEAILDALDQIETFFPYRGLSWKDSVND